MIARSLRRRFASIAIVLCAAMPTAAEQEPPGRPLIDPEESLGTLRQELAETMLVTRDNELSPCIPSDVIAFSETRPIDAGVWAGRFEVLSLGQGAWFLVVRGNLDAASWRHPIDRAGETFSTPAAAGATVEITLQGPGHVPQCPRVIMRAELSGGRPATPRGVVGRDDRWDVSAAEFQALPDTATISQWAPSVVHLQVFDTLHGLPCTGFFVTAHLLLTARHCVMTQDEASNTTLELGADIIRDLRLLVSKKVGDFSLIWVNTNAAPAPLAIRSVAAPTLVLWQSLVARQRLVSVLDCQPTLGPVGHFGHRCDTSVGTSGAPIQDRATGAVVALHTDGCMISGDPACVNVGTPIASITQLLLQKLPELETVSPEAAAELRAILK